ncbi:TetR family transcriptional regulator [Geodermatophilus sp. Leaf369]|jgi:AcrR family transcriptional regulator|uniref:TetR/AcrR family transcriptional regulator n=1 Tax=Geodermatophilus sp. Leaf369 TaxID=1736354 RepID=UPI000700C9A6|nr:TetR/AcrR family transcriptional regulator [Geodermatophilus sp. Leaf369]KQS60050.1 TetR family transcriptional regulator [Geodermatophilus sp. Leaf369]QNG37961.1 TetR/AcrR family transcriptional regulator [Geodermatophilaceae bacterium NBWT11]
MAALISTEAPRSSRGGRPRDPSRDGVIRAAILRLLADVGYNALTMDAVAAEAGVGKATIYRRWRTKSDLVVDTIAEMNRAETSTPDTGSLEGDLRGLLRSLVHVVNGPLGAATMSLLSTLPHQPALADAFRNGPLGQWTEAFREVWGRAEARGEVREGLVGSTVADAASALVVQRWLLTGEPLDEAYADSIVDTVVLPLVRERCSN